MHGVSRLKATPARRGKFTHLQVRNVLRLLAEVAAVLAGVVQALVVVQRVAAVAVELRRVLVVAGRVREVREPEAEVLAAWAVR